MAILAARCPSQVSALEKNTVRAPSTCLSFSSEQPFQYDQIIEATAYESEEFTFV